MALTPAMVRMFSPFMSAVPASSFQSSARLNTKATPLDNATKTSDDTTSKADPTPHFWNSDTNASGDSASGGDTSKSSSMKSGDTSSGTKTDDTTSRTGDTTSGGDTSRRGSTASHSGDPTIPSPRGASQSGDSSFRAGSGDSSSRSGETYTRKGSGATTSRGGDTSSGTDDISVSTQSGENRDDNSRGITSRIGDAARSVDSWRRNNTSASSWNPFSESDTDFSDFFRNPFGMFSSNNYGSHQQHAMRNFPKVDIVEEGENLKIFADLPGIEKQDIKVHLDASNNLRISGKRECEIEEEDDDRHYRRYERSCGRFSRNIRMPENVDKQSIDASFHNGVLMIQLKKTAAEDQRGSTIEIK